MRTIVLTSLILLSSCGQVSLSHPDVDPALAPYILRFEQELGLDASHVSASFVALDPSMLGLCYMYTSGNNEINVDPTAWQDMDDIGREQLMYHELGHCVLNLQHNNATVTDPNGFEVYGSMMNKYFFGRSWFYKDYRGGYKSALKNLTLLIDFTMSPSESSVPTTQN